MRGCLQQTRFWLLAVFVWTTPLLQAAVSVTDDAGHTLSLALPAQRIVSLAPHITELLFAAGAGAAVVGVSDYSDYPPAAQALPRIGGGGRLDLEAILALHPDLVIAWQSGNPPAGVQRLRELGLQVFESEPRHLEDIPRSLARFARLAGSEQRATGAIDAFNIRLTALRERYAGQAPVGVFFQIWDRPLMTVGGVHLISDVIALCGGVNVFADLDTLAPQVSIESVLARDPQLILVATDGGLDAAELGRWRHWSRLRAVLEGNLHAVARELLVRHTPRILDGAARICEVLDIVRNGTR